MPTWIPTTITCPRCAHQQRVPVARGVHVTRVPRVRDEVLARRFQELACAGCGIAVLVHAAFVYADFDRRHWLLVATADDLANWPAWEQRLAADRARAFDHGSPLAHELGEQMLARVVFGYEELREKLVVWAAGLEDAIVECLKARAIAHDLTLAAPGSRVLVDRVDGDDTIHLGWFAHAGAHSPARSFALPSRWVRDADRDRVSLQARFPQLWTAGFVAIHRLLSATIE